MTTQTAEQLAELADSIELGVADKYERFKAAAMLRSQAAEIERLRLDAERYRWLRKKVGVTFDTSYPWVWLPTGQSRIDLSDEMKTDAAIDAARAALEGK